MSDALHRAAAAAELDIEDIAPDTFLLTGPVRPYWALATAGLLALPTLGLSLLLLRIKTPGTATATVSDGDEGPLISLTGRLPDYFPSVVEHLLAERRPAPLDDDDLLHEIAALPTISSAPLQPAADLDATMARPRRIDLTATGSRLRFDDGAWVTVTRFSLIGRAPVPERGDPPAQLVPIADAGLSVSKTHLAVGVDAHGLWILDRHSTNGTSILDGSGTRTPCVPGQRYGVAPGSTVHLGDRSFSVPYSDVAAGRSQ